jgi:hypothetical protein
VSPVNDVKDEKGEGVEDARQAVDRYWVEDLAQLK